MLAWFAPLIFGSPWLAAIVWLRSELVTRDASVGYAEAARRRLSG